MSTRTDSAVSSTASLTPVDEGERILVIDILRGFALLGILLVNMSIFSAPFIGSLIGVPRGNTPIDHAAEFIIWWLATGKFYPLFSFLFGLGMSIQLARAAEHGANFTRRYARRLVVLLLFGLAHALLVWNGDILFIYALIGFLLMLFRNARPKTLLIWAGVLLALLFGLGVLSAIVNTAFLSAMPLEAMARDGLDIHRLFADLYARTVEVYSRGSWGQIFVWRAIEWVIVLIAVGFNSTPQILGLFVLGLYAGKVGIFQQMDAHRRLFMLGARLALPVGLVINAAIAWLALTAEDGLTSGNLVFAQTFLLLGGPLLTYGYLSVIVLTAQRILASPGERLRRLLNLPTAAGRMALSNYLMQSIVCTLIFYSYGLGLYGQVGAAAGLLLSIVIWAVQLPISALWLRFFRFGPLEWIWRSLTYGKPPAMRRRPLSAS